MKPILRITKAEGDVPGLFDAHLGPDGLDFSDLTLGQVASIAAKYGAEIHNADLEEPDPE